MEIPDPIITDPHTTDDNGVLMKPFTSGVISHLVAAAESEILALECKTELDQLSDRELREKREQLRDARLRLKLLEN